MSEDALVWRKQFTIFDLRHERDLGQSNIKIYFEITHPYLLRQGIRKRNLGELADMIGRCFEDLMRVSLDYDGRVDLMRQGISFRTLEDADKFINEIIEPGILAMQMAKQSEVR